MMTTLSAGGVVLNPLGQVLLVSQHHTSWSLPKGHVEAGELLLDAARREILEESGIQQLTLIKALGHYQRYRMDPDGRETPAEWKDIHMFLFQTDQVDLCPRDPENPQACWLNVDQVALRLTHAKDKAFFESICDQI